MKLHACLPLIDLQNNDSLTMGPITFCPLDRCDDAKVESALKKVGYPEKGTCILVDPKVEDSRVPFLITDAIYLLFFASQAKSLYTCDFVAHLESFTTLVSVTEHQEIQDWEQSGCIARYQINDMHPEIVEGLSKALNHLYLEKNENSHELKSVILAVQYFANCFSCRFNPFGKKRFLISHLKTAPAMALFLTASFEALFNVNLSSATPDLKQKLRPILRLKFGRPVEVIWKWVEGFYQMRNHIVHSENIKQEIFEGNSDFKIPYTILASKIFVYSVYYKLWKQALISSTYDEQFDPPKFQDINPEEIITFFWTELNLLRKVSIVMEQLLQGNQDEELVSDLHTLCKRYLYLFNHFIKHPEESKLQQITCLPEDPRVLQPIIDSVHELSKKPFMYKGECHPLSNWIPDCFFQALIERLDIDPLHK